MAYQQKDMEGSLFKNDKKEKDTHPHMKGSCTIDGVEYWISAWTNEGAKGRWQGLKFKRKDKQQAAPQPAPQRQQRSAPADMDDDVPF